MRVAGPGMGTSDHAASERLRPHRPSAAGGGAAGYY